MFSARDSFMAHGDMRYETSLMALHCVILESSNDRRKAHSLRLLAKMSGNPDLRNSAQKARRVVPRKDLQQCKCPTTRASLFLRLQSAITSAQEQSQPEVFEGFAIVSGWDKRCSLLTLSCR